MIRILICIIVSSISFGQEVFAQSKLLEGVKRNPGEAKSICKKFRELNENNISASSKESIEKISIQKNISEIDAEILAMYVRGLHCPETF
tara:strand:- start:162 stop:431 length:270 start_codon:yes stop_codon:yes gene_type:complete